MEIIDLRKWYRIVGMSAILILASNVGCSRATWGNVLDGVAAMGQAQSRNPDAPGTALANGSAILIFGGPDHKTFLGCLTCSDLSTSSVLNHASIFGSSNSLDSVFNKSGQFGSTWSQYSACNSIASDPPVLVDHQGNFYGRLTINTSNPQVSRNPQVNAWIQGVCGG